MIIGSYELYTVEEAFNVALKIDLTFKRLVNAKAQCSKCKRYGHFLATGAPRRVDMFMTAYIRCS